ncbi:RsmE family RNA methyltransferase [Pleomorphochaeta sp. DL1XJH-081]|jgi:16S rRNA (uracil1498-N3)-methyltransferase|uniref:RsmE family RNA methyltransferase n=1 Tax=Pleomorphochaeta sp. DL1XJH-081 TaxID=3409690 RepID=UPI003BB77B73
MRIFVLPSDFRGASRYTIEGKDVHYLTKVLRLSEGDSITGRDIEGKFWDITIQTIRKDSCILACHPTQSIASSSTDSLPVFRGPFPEIHLYQAICKGKKMEQIVRQATELGVTRIIPISTEFCVADISKKEKDRISRYESIAKEAMQQSGSPVVTEIGKPLPFDKVASDWNGRGTALLFHQTTVEKQKELYEILQIQRDNKIHTPIAIVIGSEGGFSEREVASLIAENFLPVLLKTNILRAETAAIASIAIVQQFMVDTVS